MTLLIVLYFAAVIFNWVYLIGNCNADNRYNMIHQSKIHQYGVIFILATLGPALTIVIVILCVIYSTDFAWRIK